MTPLIIRAHLDGEVSFPGGPPALDALLIWAACALVGRETARPGDADWDDKPTIPLAQSSGIYLASHGYHVPEKAHLRYVNRRFPLDEAQTLGNAKLRVVNIQGGPCKSYRLPSPTAHLEGDLVTWWAIGDGDAVRDLLESCIGYLGKRRATGRGRVRRWEVERCTPWGEGFPVVRDGAPMRPLPTSWPGLRGRLTLRYGVLTPPYWEHTREELLAVPSWPEERPAWDVAREAVA